MVDMVQLGIDTLGQFDWKFDPAWRRMSLAALWVVIKKIRST